MVLFLGCGKGRRCFILLLWRIHRFTCRTLWDFMDFCRCMFHLRRLLLSESCGLQKLSASQPWWTARMEVQLTVHPKHVGVCFKSLLKSSPKWDLPRSPSTRRWQTGPEAIALPLETTSNKTNYLNFQKNTGRLLSFDFLDWLQMYRRLVFACLSSKERMEWRKGPASAQTNLSLPRSEYVAKLAWKPVPHRGWVRELLYFFLLPLLVVHVPLWLVVHLWIGSVVWCFQHPTLVTAFSPPCWWSIDAKAWACGKALGVNQASLLDVGRLESAAPNVRGIHLVGEEAHLAGAPLSSFSFVPLHL